MATYIALVNFTQQGLQNIHESPHRAAAFKAAARKMGAKVSQVFWTLGAHDGAIVFEAKDDQVATTLMLTLASLGNVRTTTLRAFTAAEFADIVGKTPRM